MKEAAPNRSPLSTPTMDPATMSASPAGATTHHDKLHSPEPLGDVATPPPPVHHPAQAPNFPPSVGSPATQEMESSGWVADRARGGGMTPEPNPYVAPSPAAPPTSYKDTIETVKSVFTRWRQKIGESAKMAEDLSRNTWQHLNTGPSFTEAAMGRIAQGTKVIAEGGYENIFRQTFETLPEEQLRKSYACYLSTSAGPVMGILYLSSAKLAFCSDNPLPYKAENKTEWSHYKVIIPLHQLRACNPSISSTNSAEKYIQIVSVDNHEFWFMSFVNYSDAVQNLEETMQQVRRSAI